MKGDTHHAVLLTSTDPTSDTIACIALSCTSWKDCTCGNCATINVVASCCVFCACVFIHVSTQPKSKAHTETQQQSPAQTSDLRILQGRHTRQQHGTGEA